VILTPELITAIFQGAVLVFGALGITAAQRSRRASVSRRAHRALQREHLAALGHIFRLETELAEHGVPVPARPEILEKDDDDGGPALPPVPEPAT
jgi:hypothetical protein